MYNLCTKRELIKIFAHPIVDPETNKVLYISFPSIVQLFGEKKHEKTCFSYNFKKA